MQTDQTKDPAGETQTFEPRPRPATCVVAVNVKPVGMLESNLVFLRMVNFWPAEKERENSLLEHRVRAGHNFSIH
jgi:hypothetical protein